MSKQYRNETEGAIVEWIAEHTAPGFTWKWRPGLADDPYAFTEPPEPFDPNDPHGLNRIITVNLEDPSKSTRGLPGSQTIVDLTAEDTEPWPFNVYFFYPPIEEVGLLEIHADDQIQLKCELADPKLFAKISACLKKLYHPG